MSARDRFNETRKAVVKLAEVQALLWSEGDDWKPPNIGKTGNSDPTANRAIYNVDELDDRLSELRSEEARLIDFIGMTLEIVEGVRKGLGEEYASILDQRYIDGLAWRDVVVNGEQVKPRTGRAKVAIAFDWIDSLGVSYILRGEYEI